MWPEYSLVHRPLSPRGNEPGYKASQGMMIEIDCFNFGPWNCIWMPKTWQILYEISPIALVSHLCWNVYSNVVGVLVTRELTLYLEYCTCDVWSWMVKFNCCSLLVFELCKKVSWWGALQFYLKFKYDLFLDAFDFISQVYSQRNSTHSQDTWTYIR